MRHGWVWFFAGAFVLALATRLGIRAFRARELANTFLHGQPAKIERPTSLQNWRDVSFASSGGVVLRGWYHDSADGSAVVLVHGWGQSRLGLIKEAERIAARGHGVLVFDLRAHGESGGSVCTMGDKERDDFKSAVAFVASQPGVKRELIGALGFSIGASAVAEVAARETRLASLVLVAPYSTLEESERFDFQGFGPLGEWLAFRQFQRAGVDLQGVRPIDDLSRLDASKLFVIYGSQEPDPDMVQRILAATPKQAQTWVIAGAKHGEYLQSAGETYLDRVAHFFDETLKPHG